jgi:hypothetical protein
MWYNQLNQILTWSKHMTTLLETVFEKASTLSEIEQNRFAKLFMDEIQSEKKWDELFSESEDVLADMGDMVLDDYTNAKIKPLIQEEL